ncbi:MAG TPA: SRPBCC domain-containing protein [Candidatus Acidoferrales bacterium]|jgi:activator of HSP90 ATPase|nr:SRPBCC domain-containing protein [Candidatus Acidoferrales bacterium]
MTRAIQQSVVLRASPEELFHTFLDSKKHSAVTGAPAKASAKLGGKWNAWGGAISGRNLLIVPGRMIVQAWRSSVFKKSEPDSILVLTFGKVKGGGRIDLVHVNVPWYDHKGVREGWPTYYWKPWKAYLKRKR